MAVLISYVFTPPASDNFICTCMWQQSVVGPDVVQGKQSETTVEACFRIDYINDFVEQLIKILAPGDIR